MGDMTMPAVMAVKAPRVEIRAKGETILSLSVSAGWSTKYIEEADELLFVYCTV